MVPLNYKLQNAQRVEIMAAKQGGPSRDWLAREQTYLASPRALAKVRQWFDMRYEFEDPWVRAAYATERWLTLTPDQLTELSERIEDLVREYHESPAEGEDAQRVFFFAHAVPASP